MADPTMEDIAKAMFKIVTDATAVKKKLKAMDLVKAVRQLYPDVDKKLAKNAVKHLVDSGQCVYTYFGGSFVELPHREASAND